MSQCTNLSLRGELAPVKTQTLYQYWSIRKGRLVVNAWHMV